MATTPGGLGKDTGTVAAREAAQLVAGRNAAQPGWALGLGTLVVFLGAVSAAINTISLKPMAAALAAPAPAIIWVAVAYLVPFASVVLVAGKLADTIGHRRVLLASLAVYTVGSALGAIAGSVMAVVGYRVLQGIGGAGLLISLAWVTKAWDGPRQGMAVGIWRAFLLAGTVGGPPLGGALTALLGWRSVMWITAPAGLIALVLAWRYLREPGTPRGIGGFDWAGATSVVAGLSALIAALSTLGAGSGAGTPATVTGALFAVAAAAALAWWWSLRRTASPVADLRLFRLPRFGWANVGTLMICVGMFSVMFFIPLFLQYYQRYTPMAAAAALLPATLVALAVGIAGGWITDRAGPVIPAVTGFALLGAGFVMFAFLTAATPAAYTETALILTGIGMALPLSPTALVAITAAGAGSEGEAAGIFNVAHNFGRPLGLGTLGVAFTTASLATYHDVFWGSAAYMLLAMAAAVGLRAPRPAAPRPDREPEKVR